MSPHIAPDMLDAFVLGDLGDHAAALVARHLDACPACTARVMAADPLTAALRVPEPVVPPDLIARVLVATTPAPAGLARREMVAGLALLAAGLLAVAFSADLSAVGARLDVLASALATTRDQLRAQPAVLASLGASSTATALLALVLASRLSGRVR